MNKISKNDKYKKLNMAVYKTDMSITTVDIYKKTEQEFYDGEQNTWTLLNTKNWTLRNTKQTWTLLKLTNTKKTEQHLYHGLQN